MKLPFSHDPLTGVTTWFHDDPGIDGFHLETTQDVEPIIKTNRAIQNETDGWSKGRNMRHAATIPMVLLHQWAQELGITIHDPAMAEVIKTKLNDPDYRNLRTGVFNI